MQSVGPSGFYNVPATKCLILFIGTISVLASIFGLKQHFHLQLTPHITVHHQFSRLFLSHVAFSSSGDFLFGSIILYSMRIIERQYGTSKYTAFLFITTIISTILEVVMLIVGGRIGLKSIPSGPYAIIFAILYQYYRVIPVTYRFRIFGIVMTDKLFLTDVANIKQWRFPKSVQFLASRFILPFFTSSPNPRSSTTVPIQRPIITSLSSVDNILANGLMNRRNNTATNTNETIASARSSLAAEGSSSVREYLDTITGRDVVGSDLEPPSPEYTRILMTMFPDHPRETITRALSSAHNDLNRAVEIMLSTPSPAGESSSSSNNRR
ncbi:hypothetical protein CU097_013012 [Rhizopus azygosporus]|uniref:CUE domain-containing protein n=1 Tax=Rhizopus azygosporus TaxID=86630 RepID=A0A367JYC5_RHIAZ|nr:hypothetical protein CU097_013012 [Rhizopus azygosporus]